MTGPEQFRQYTDQVLFGLKADEQLKHRILQKAAETGQPEKKSFFRRPVPVLCSMVAVLVLCVFLLNGQKPVSSDPAAEINTFAAGQTVYTDASLQSSLAMELVRGIASSAVAE